MTALTADISSLGILASDALDETSVWRPKDALTRSNQQTMRWTEFEEIDTIDTGAPNLAELSTVGQALTADLLHLSDQRDSILALIHALAIEGLSWNSDHSGRISVDTALAATALLRLPILEFALPKISPDGEGGLMILWEKDAKSFLMTVDNWRIHMVVNPGTRHAQYLDNLAFDGEHVPPSLLKAINS